MFPSFYFHKARQYAQLAKEAADSQEREPHEAESRRFFDLAKQAVMSLAGGVLRPPADSAKE